MTNPDAGAPVLDDFLRQFEADEPEDAAVNFGVSGGPPGKRLETEVTVNNRGEGRVVTRDEFRGEERRERALQLSRDEATELLRSVGNAARELQPRSRHRIPPDSLVGWVLIESRGRRAGFCFAAEEHEGQLRQREVASPAIDGLMTRLRHLTAVEERRSP